MRHLDPVRASGSRSGSSSTSSTAAATRGCARARSSTRRRSWTGWPAGSVCARPRGAAVSAPPEEDPAAFPAASRPSRPVSPLARPRSGCPPATGCRTGASWLPARARTRSAPRTARYPATGWHTRGEMGGIWTPPIKLLDGVWFAARRHLARHGHAVHRGQGYTSMAYPAGRRAGRAAPTSRPTAHARRLDRARSRSPARRGRYGSPSTRTPS